MTNNSPVVVVGTRRSGTSMIAGILHKLGVDMGKDPERSSEKNPKGFFEDKRHNKISEEILGFVKENPKSSLAKLDLKFGDKMDELIKKRQKENDLWGFKDTNLPLTIQIWHKHLDNARYILIFRNPLDVGLSISDWHDKLDIPPATITAINHYQMMAQFFTTSMNPETKQQWLSFEAVRKNPKKTVEDMIKFLDIEPTDQQKQQAINHIDPNLDTKKA